jgi:hypothetical protein
MSEPQAPAIPVPRPPLDDRVMANGSPVSRLTVKRHRYGGWFVIRRPKGSEDPDGVILEVRIPGCFQNQPYPDQAAAVIGADELYAEYRDAIDRLKAG